MSKILITGANGFVGSYLTSYLGSRDNKVSVAARKKLEVGKNVVSYLVGDVNATTDWSSAVENQDVVIHLANLSCVPNLKGSDCRQVLNTVNVEGTLRLAEAAAQSGVKRFIFLSSIKVNGEVTLDSPFCDNDEASPQDEYAKSKLEAEIGLKAFCKDSGLELVILRPPLIYGPKVKGNLGLLEKMVNVGIPLPFASIANTRDIISLKNLSDLICVCVDHPGAVGQTFLCSDGQPITTPELIAHIALAQGRRPLLFPFPVKILSVLALILGQKEKFQRIAGDLRIDMDYTQKKLDWTPPFTVDESIKWAFSDD